MKGALTGSAGSQDCLDEAHIRVMKRTLDDARDMLIHERKFKVPRAYP